MNTEELESILDGGEETTRVEFKAASNWNADRLAKDFLAMANLQDGGKIVFGVEDETFQRQGMSEEQINSFNPDIMKDQISPYADPHVTFKVHKLADSQGRRYVVVDIHSFDEIPVVCKRDGPDVHAGTVYYRSSSRRPQSARVSNSTDMREIVEVAVSRRMQKMRRIGFTVPDQHQHDFEAELGGL